MHDDAQRRRPAALELFDTRRSRAYIWPETALFTCFEERPIGDQDDGRPEMKRAQFAVGVAAGLAMCLTLSQAPVTAQAARTGKATAPASGHRTAWGDPDLQGIWTGSTITPLERPAKFADKKFLTEAEAAQLEKDAVADQVDRPPKAGDPGTYNQIWFDPSSKVLPDRRTSLIIDPPDGRIPYTPDGAKAQELARQSYGRGDYSTWFGLDTGERCITDGPPIYFSGYNNNYQIVQSRGYVSILHELYRELRVIPVDGQPVSNVPALDGNPRGHWDGDTLVVESAHFRELEGSRWADAWRAVRRSTRLVERFRRVDAHTIDYQFTWEDPAMFTRPWTAAYPLSNDQRSRGVTSGQLYEYACHEGNYALGNILRGARMAEAARQKPSR